MLDKHIHVNDQGVLKFLERRYRCSIGENGFNDNLVEGDKTTPIGRYPIRRLLYREDKVEKPVSVFPTSVIQKDDGWSDDVRDPAYNMQVKLPHPFSHEEMWRPDDNLYDIVVVLGQNDNPVIPNKGSAIFMHIARPAYTPTLGCVALSEQDLREVLTQCRLTTLLCIGK